MSDAKTSGAVAHVEAEFDGSRTEDVERWNKVWDADVPGQRGWGGWEEKKPKESSPGSITQWEQDEVGTAIPTAYPV